MLFYKRYAFMIKGKKAMINICIIAEWNGDLKEQEIMTLMFI